MSRKLATSQYDDLLCRASLADTGTIPRTPPLEESPDVIPVGTAAVLDPKVYFTGNYGKNVAKPVVAEEANLIYVRGKNLAPAVQNGDVYVYWARAEDLDSPSKWQGNQLLTVEGHGSFRLTDVEPGAITVATSAFTWTPDAALEGKSAVLIGVLATNDHPNPVPTLRSPLDFNRWVSKQGGVGAFKTTVVSKPKPDPTVTLSGDFKLAEGGLAEFLVTVTDMPLGTEVSLKLTTPVDGHTISIPQTRITQNPQTIGVSATVPQNYTSQIETRIAPAGSGVPGSNNSVVTRAQYTPPGASGPVRPVLLARYSIHFGK